MKWPKKVNIVQFRDGKYGVRIGRFFWFSFLDVSRNNTGDNGKLLQWRHLCNINKYCKTPDLSRAKDALYAYTNINFKDMGRVV